jgi:hypothetical protein
VDDLAHVDLPDRHRAALSIARDLTPDERIDLLALVIWGPNGASGGEQVRDRGERRAERHADDRFRSSLNGRRVEQAERRRGPLTFESRQLVRQIVDLHVRESLGLTDQRHRRRCEACNIWYQDGFTPGCADCDRRAKARARRSRWQSRQQAAQDTMRAVASESAGA